MIINIIYLKAYFCVRSMSTASCNFTVTLLQRYQQNISKTRILLAVKRNFFWNTITSDEYFIKSNINQPNIISFNDFFPRAEQVVFSNCSTWLCLVNQQNQIERLINIIWMIMAFIWLNRTSRSQWVLVEHISWHMGTVSLSLLWCHYVICTWWIHLIFLPVTRRVTLLAPGQSCYCGNSEIYGKLTGTKLKQINNIKWPMGMILGMWSM